MTIERIKGRVMIECNGKSCHEAFDGSTDFQETITSAKEEGWKMRCVDGVWFHYCPDCEPSRARPDIGALLGRKP